ncbi:unnamed protein product [Trichobilharzia regenti]|nr:unnamed protein product [Trichobilharzia regenti]
MLKRFALNQIDSIEKKCFELDTYLLQRQSSAGSLPDDLWSLFVDYIKEVTDKRKEKHNSHLMKTLDEPPPQGVFLTYPEIHIQMFPSVYHSQL